MLQVLYPLEFILLEQLVESRQVVPCVYQCSRTHEVCLGWTVSPIYCPVPQLLAIPPVTTNR